MSELIIPAPSLPRAPHPRPSGAIRRGSSEHLTLFCLELLETHDPYRPAVIDWPVLADEARARLTSLPIWDIAVQTEGRAGRDVLTFGEQLPPGLLREAVIVDAFEEARHKQVLANMVQFYGIALQPEPHYAVPRDPEWAFMRTGYSECIDSFFGFGLFALARDSGFFPAELVDTFEPVMREEGRHILFFVNWVAWWRRNMPEWRRPWFELKVLAVWVYLVWERIGTAQRVGSNSPADDFMLHGSKSLGLQVSFKRLAEVCLRENDRRLAPYDARLLRPRLVPWVVRFVTRWLRDEPARAGDSVAG